MVLLGYEQPWVGARSAACCCSFHCSIASACSAVAADLKLLFTFRWDFPTGATGADGTGAGGGPGGEGGAGGGPVGLSLITAATKNVI